VICLVLLLTRGQVIAVDTLTVIAGGDVMLDRGVRTLIDLVGVEPLFDDIAPLWDGADVVLVNLEGSVVAAEHANPVNKSYVFRFEPEWLHPLKRIGITHLGLANNHVLDHGLTGLRETIGHIEAVGLIPISDSPKPVLVETGDVTVAILAANLLDSPEDATHLLDSVQRYSEAFPRVHIITYLHWGVEYQPHPDSTQIEIAHELIDFGADAVIGHHPHVVQTIERYRGGLIVFSLGNLLFDQSKPCTEEGYLVELRFTADPTVYDARLHMFRHLAGVPMFTETRELFPESR